MKSGIIFLLGLALIPSAFAASLHIPAACPSVATITSTGLDFVRRDARLPQFWNGAVAKNKFDTEDEWSLHLGVFSGRDEAEARKNGQAALATLRLTYGPVELMGKKRTHPGIWSCWYDNQDGSVQGMALTPAQNVS